MGRLSSSNRPLPEKNGWHGFQPWTSGKRDCAIGQTNSLPKRKSALGASNALDPAFVAICESDLGEAGVHIDKCAPSRPLILFSPIPERHCPHDEEVGSRTDLLKFFQGHPKRSIVIPIDPVFSKAERLQAGVDVSSGIIQLMGPFLLFPDVNPGRTSAIFQVEDFVAKCAQTKQVLQNCPGLAAQTGQTDGA